MSINDTWLLQTQTDHFWRWVCHIAKSLVALAAHIPTSQRWLAQIDLSPMNDYATRPPPAKKWLREQAQSRWFSPKQKLFPRQPPRVFSIATNWLALSRSDRCLYHGRVASLRQFVTQLVGRLLDRVGLLLLAKLRHLSRLQCIPLRSRAVVYWRYRHNQNQGLLVPNPRRFCASLTVL